MLRHPGALEELVEAVVAHVPLHHQLGRMCQRELAVQLPIAIAPDRGAMGEIGMAASLALRPIADVVLTDHAVGAGHSDQGAEIDEQAFEPEWAVIGPVNEAAMHAE